MEEFLMRHGLSQYGVHAVGYIVLLVIICVAAAIFFNRRGRNKKNYSIRVVRPAAKDMKERLRRHREDTDPH